MMRLKQLSREDLVEIHRQQVEQFGGQHGVRDWQALDGAIYEASLETSAPGQAAALLTEIIAGHPFHAANKRCAANAALVTLLLNGQEPACTPEQLVILIHALDLREIDRRGVMRFFREQ
jgi:death on curing protein